LTGGRKVIARKKGRAWREWAMTISEQTKRTMRAKTLQIKKKGSTCSALRKGRGWLAS